jgi:ACS family tartrate transporter-like MFS transporter
MVLLVMGVTGSGKSTVARLLAARLGWVFLEADDFHSPANKEKMHRGIPLSDDDRLPWLDAIQAELVRQNKAGNNVVLACSALKEEYRKRLSHGLDVKVVYLKGSFELIESRLRGRTGHFAGESILVDQFAVLEEPHDAIVVDVAAPPEAIVDQVLSNLSAAPAAGQSLAKSLLAKLRWRLMPFLFLLYVVAYLDRINVGFAALQMKDQLGFSDTVYGFGAGIFFAGYFLFQVPSNMALQRVGARPWIAVLMVLWGVISSSMLFIHSANSFYSLRFLLGAAEAGFVPGVIYYLRRWFPPVARGGVLALFMTAGPVSGIIGGPISGALLDWQRFSSFAGWQKMFLLEGIPAVLLGLVAYFYLPERPEEAHWLSVQEKSWLARNLRVSDSSAPSSSSHSTGPWFASPFLWAFALVDFGLNTCTYGVTMWLPSVLKSLTGLPNLLLGFLTMVPNLVAVVLMILVGAHSDRTAERRWHIALSAFCGALALLVAGYSSAVSVTLAAFSIALAASSSMFGPFWAMATATLPETAAAGGIALINAVGNLGSGFGPFWIGRLRDLTGSYRAGLVSVAALIFLAGLLTLLLQRPSAGARLTQNAR